MLLFCLNVTCGWLLCCLLDLVVGRLVSWRFDWYVVAWVLLAIAVCVGCLFYVVEFGRVGCVL